MPPDKQGEDCLRLNVWMPDGDSRQGGARAVMVMLHGGAWRIGTGDFDGSALARRSDVVVVGVTHRLNVFGYLQLGHRFGEEFAGSGNVGLLDLAAAFRWIRDNIAQFGGDPDKVMVFGTSGGGAKVAATMAMPMCSGLYRAGAVIDGHDLWKRNGMEAAERSSQAVLRELGIGPGELRKLQEVSAPTLVAAFREATLKYRPDPAWGPAGWVMYDLLAPVIDGTILPDRPVDALAKKGIGVEMMVGTGRLTHWVPLAAGPRFGWLNDADAVRHLRPVVGEGSEEIFAAYRRNRPHATASSLLATIVTDRDWRIPAIRLAESRAASGKAAFMWFGTEGMNAYQQITDAYPPAPPEYRSANSSQVHGAFAAFAKTGDPATSELPAWPRYTADDRATMMFADEPHLATDPWPAERAAWDGIR